MQQPLVQAPLWLQRSPMAATSPIYRPANRFHYYNQLGQAAYQIKDYDEAISFYTKAHRLASWDTRVIMTLAQIYREQGKLDKSASYYTKAAREFARKGSYDKAAALLGEVLETHPGDVKVRQELINLFKAAEKTARNETIRLQMQARLSRALADLTSFIQTVENKDTRRSLLKLLVDVDPCHWENRRFVGRQLAEMGCRSLAVENLVTAAKLALQRNATGPAGDLLEEASGIAGSHPDIQAVFFRLQIVEGFTEVGLTGLKALYKAHPQNIEIAKTLAHAYYAMDDMLQARHWFFEVFRLNNTDTYHLEKIARKFQRMGKHDDAHQTLLPIVHHLNQLGDGARAKRLLAITR